MKKGIFALLMVFCCVTLFYSCGPSGEPEGDSTDEPVTDEYELTSSEANEQDDADPGADEAAIKEFLYSTEGTYGWKSTQEEFFYDFFKDGRLSIQGDDGEATMWEGKWSLAGNQLTLESPDATETVTVKIDGEQLMIGGVAYERYKP